MINPPTPPPSPPHGYHDESLPLHLALNEGRFFLLYQPIFDIRSPGAPSLFSFEALLRLHTTQNNDFSPDSFLDVIRRNPDLRFRATWFVIDQAVSDFNLFGIPEQIGLNLNVWAADIEEPQFPASLMNLIRKRGFLPSRLSLELLGEDRGEIDLMSNSILRLINTGIKIGLDDFGVGVSNLNRLFFLSPAFVKVDKTFCPDLNQPRKTQICNVITIAANLAGSIVIQEGIESEAQLHLARGLGIHYAQGYFLGRPASIESLLTEFGHTINTNNNQVIKKNN